MILSSTPYTIDIFFFIIFFIVIFCISTPLSQ